MYTGTPRSFACLAASAGSIWPPSRARPREDDRARRHLRRRWSSPSCDGCGSPTRSDRATASPMACPLRAPMCRAPVTTSRDPRSARRRRLRGSRTRRHRRGTSPAPRRGRSCRNARRIEPCRLDVGRLHRPRDVQREHDRRLFARNAHRRMRSGHTDDEEHESDEHQQWWQVPKATGLRSTTFGRRIRIAERRPCDATRRRSRSMRRDEDRNGRRERAERGQVKLTRLLAGRSRADGASRRRS